MAQTSAPRHRLLTCVIALTPFSAVPFEVPGLGGAGLGLPLASAIVLLAASRGSLGRKATGIGLLLGLLAIWVTIRLTVLSLGPGESIEFGPIAREVGGLCAAAAAFSLARREELRPAIFMGLCIALALTLTHEAYQVTAGLARLQSLGYVSENGFFYYTFDGSYRPFGGFSGPTTFGTFLAMLGVLVAFSMRPGARRVAICATVGIGVLLTDTRAAWIGCVLAALVVTFASPKVRKRLAAPAAMGVLVLVAVVLTLPAQTGEVMARATSATEQSDTSRVTRTGLWEGIVSATQGHGRQLDGFGAQDWTAIMFPEVGPLAGLGHAHSNFFQEWFRYGLIGFLIFAALVVAMLVTSWRSARIGGTHAAGALAAAVIYLADSVFNNSLSSINFTVAAFLIIGMGYARPTPTPTPATRLDDRRSFANST